MKIFTNKYKTSFVRILCFFFLFAFQNSFSQTYPITSSFQIIPPYNVYLPDYCVPGSDKIRVILLQNDLTVPSYEVRLRMTVEWNGSVIMRTSPNFTPSPITLSAGVPNLVSGNDLCVYFATDAIDFTGYNRENYERTKTLPEGAYRISFTAYDYRRQNVQVSNVGSNIFFLQKKDPPLLNSPSCSFRIPKIDPQFITFNWSSVNTPSLPGNETEYTFSLYEIKPKNSDPNFIIRSSAPIYTTVTQNNILSYGPGEPALLDDMEYVWIVQARSSDGRDLYANQGNSRPCKFSYGGVDPFHNLPRPTVFAQPLHERAALIWCPPARQQNIVEGYRIEYRGSTNSTGEFPWHTEEKESDTTFNISSLEPEREYEVRSSWKVNGVYGPYSEVVKFTTPKPRKFECGEDTAPTVFTNQTPLQSAEVGMIVKIGSLNIALLEISGSNGTFSGKGKIANIGFLHGLRMNFSNIFINTDLVVTRGEMQADAEPIEGYVKKALDKQHGGGDTGKTKTGDVIPEITTTLSILSIADVKVDTGKGTITLKDQQTGKEEVINYKEKNHKLPLTIEDKNGNLYNVDKNGKVSPAGKRGAAGSIPPLATLNTLNPELGKIIFGPGNNNKYAFDTWKDSYTNAKELLTSRYENLNGYRVSAKAIAPGEQETITARLEKPANSNIDPTKIKFVSGKGITWPSTNQGNNFTITITGGPANDAQEVFAIANNNGKDISIGKLLVASYAIAEKKLVLIPIGNLKSGLQEAITQGMKKAYAPITVNYTVEVDNSFSTNKEWSKSGNGILQDSRSSFLSNNFTGEEKALLKVYKKTHTIDKDAVYLFVVNEAALRDGDLLGKMPRQSQFGFLFVKDATNENIARTAAHEIGHGAYTLAHPFSAEVGLTQSTTNTLMDYGTGYDFLKFQWDIVHQPGNVWGVFEDDKEGQNYRVEIDAKFLNKDKLTVSFLSKTGSIISLPRLNIGKVELSYGAVTAPNQDPSQGLTYTFDNNVGCLHAFSLLNDNKFDYYKYNSAAKAYETEGGKKYNNSTDYAQVDGVIYPISSGTDFTLYKFTKGGLPSFADGAGKTMTFSEVSDVFKPFTDANSSVRGNEGILKQVIPNSISKDCMWCRDTNTANMTTPYLDKPELYFIDKIAQLRNVFPEYFKRFTQINENWASPIDDTQTITAPNTVNTAPINVPYTNWQWGKYLSKYPVLKSNFTSKTNLREYFKTFCYVLKDSIDAGIKNESRFWVALNSNTPALNVVQHLNTEPFLQITKAPLGKRLLALKILTDGSLQESKENAAMKIMGSIAPENQSEALSYIAANIGLKNIFNKFHDIFGEDNFTRVATLLTTFITNPRTNENAMKLMAGVDPKLTSVDVDLWDNRKTEGYYIDNDNNVHFYNRVRLAKKFTDDHRIPAEIINQEFLVIPYNELMPVEFWSSFQLADKTFQKRDVITMPAIFAALLVDKAGRQLFSRKAWLVADGVMLLLGVGEVKILFSSASWIRQAIVASDIVGSSAAIIDGMVTEGSIPAAMRQKISYAYSILQLPMGIRSLGELSTFLNKTAQDIRQLKNLPNSNLSPAAQKKLDDFVVVLERNGYTGGGANVATYISSLKNKGFSVFEEIDNVIFVRDAGNRVGKILDKTKLDDITWFSPTTGNTWRIHETNSTEYLKFKYGSKVSTQVKVRTYHKNGQYVDGYLDDLVETNDGDLLIFEAKHSQKAQIVDGVTPGYTAGQTKSYQWLTDGDAVKIEYIGAKIIPGLNKGDNILLRLKGKVTIITNDANGQLVETSILKTTK